MSVLKSEQARGDILNRLKRAEGQLRGLQRMLEKQDDCMKISQQLSAVRKALDSTYLRMAMCLIEQEFQQRCAIDVEVKAEMAPMLRDMESILARIN